MYRREVYPRYSFVWKHKRYKRRWRGFHGKSGTVEVALPALMATTPSLRSRFIGQGYKQACGRADVPGDGLVPEESARLEGALNISLMDFTTHLLVQLIHRGPGVVPPLSLSNGFITCSPKML